MEMIDGLRAAVIIIRDGRILLMHRFREGQEYYVFPGGGVEEGESPEVAAVRELKEEFNIKIEIDKELFQVINTAYSKTRREHYFLVNNFSGEPVIGGEELEWMREDPTNIFEPAWIPLSEVKDINLVPQSAKEKLLNEVNLTS